VESGYNSAAIGADGERGMMQVMPPTAALLGFRGSAAELAEPATNIRLGVTYLADAWRLAKGDLCRALMKYRAGHNQERMTPLSVEYCRRAKSHLAGLGSSLGSGALPSPSLGEAPALATPAFAKARRIGVMRRVAGRLLRVMPIRTATSSSQYWAAHEARVRAITQRLEGKRRAYLARS
jgi:hypothetical protein